MCDIIICGVSEITRILHLNRSIDVIISISDPVKSTKEQLTQIELQEKFEKFEVYYFSFLDYRKRNPSNKTDRIPSQDDVIQMKNLCSSIITNKKSCLFHCKSGVSRSAAFAYILLRESGLNELQANLKIKHIRNISRPNPRITFLYEELKKCTISQDHSGAETVVQNKVSKRGTSFGIKLSDNIRAWMSSEIYHHCSLCGVMFPCTDVERIALDRHTRRLAGSGPANVTSATNSTITALLCVCNVTINEQNRITSNCPECVSVNLL
jgi:protein-tyrosine phosphatase